MIVIKLLLVKDLTGSNLLFKKPAFTNNHTLLNEYRFDCLRFYNNECFVLYKRLIGDYVKAGFLFFGKKPRLKDIIVPYICLVLPVSL
jgi:hypothetical protein